jgi:hypothetical protein
MFEVTDEVVLAQHGLEIAWSHFNEATERRSIAIAAYELTAAQLRLDAVIARAKRAKTVERPRKAG